MAARRLAQRNPHLYDLMFGLSTRGSYRPPRSLRVGRGERSEAFQAIYTHVVQACERLVSSGRIRSGQDPEIIASQLWSCVHGFITLELRGQFDQFPDPVRQILQPMTISVFLALGDRPERAAKSYASVLDADQRHARTR
jgi:hypothetical protein